MQFDAPLPPKCFFSGCFWRFASFFSRDRCFRRHNLRFSASRTLPKPLLFAFAAIWRLRGGTVPLRARMKALFGLLDLFLLFSLQMPRFLPFLRLCLAFENKFLCFALPCLAFNRFDGFSLFLPSICPLYRSFFSPKRAVLYIEKKILFHVKHFARFKRGISRFLRKQKGALKSCKSKKARKSRFVFHVKPFPALSQPIKFLSKSLQLLPTPFVCRSQGRSALYANEE